MLKNWLWFIKNREMLIETPQVLARGIINSKFVSLLNSTVISSCMISHPETNFMNTAAEAKSNSSMKDSKKEKERSSAIRKEMLSEYIGCRQSQISDPFGFIFCKISQRTSSWISARGLEKWEAPLFMSQQT